MKILFVHTAYKERGGEDSVFANELELLSEVAEVDTLTFSNSGSVLNVLKKFILAPWNYESAARLKQKINNFNPDIIHLHNWHFAASPAIISIAKKMNVPIVMTLHNYRLLCPSASLYYDGKIFLDSLDKGFPWKAVFKRVYRNSLLQTFWLAFIVHFHHWIGTWAKVDQYIALTDFGKELFGRSKLRLKKSQIVTKGNFVKDKGYNLASRSDQFLFVGRLTKDKGIELLLEAFSGASQQLKIIGDGPLRTEVTKAANTYPNINYDGPKQHAEIIAEMKNANALIFPSVWYEGMPMTILEAFSTGTPVLASNLGAMKSLVVHQHNGLLFEVTESNSILHAITAWENLSITQKGEYCTNARHTFEANFTPEKNLNSILSIYKKTINQTNHFNNCNDIEHFTSKTLKTESV